MIWTDEMREMLMTLVMDGVPYGKIARRISEQFDVKLTKNACVGMSRRIGAPRRPPAIQPVEKPANITITDLASGMCRWPLTTGDEKPPYFYCGEPCVEGCSWCPDHAKRVFVKPSSGSAKIYHPVY